MSADSLQALRASLRDAGHVLTDRVFAHTMALSRCCADGDGELAALKDTAPDYGRDEFLLSVATTGSVVEASEEMLAAFRAEPDAFRLWFRDATLDDGRRVLLVARWLCHLAGFRHRAVHIFLDHPTCPDYTFVQIRSFAKINGPAALDVLVGGHAKDTASLDATVADELRDELGLDVETDIDGLVPIGAFDYHGSDALFDSQNIEYRVVSCGRLRPEAIARVHFADGEVAALCLFAVPELARYLAACPDRVASGLVGSFPLYARHRNRQGACREE